MRHICSLTLLLFSIFPTFSQTINHYPELIFSKSSYNSPIMGYDLAYFTPKKGHLGAWGFAYADTKSFETVVGPAYTSKTFYAGIGGGYEFISKSPVIAIFANTFNETDEVYGYLEKGKTWYWYQTYYEHTFKNNVLLGCYSQTGIGTGIRSGYKYNNLSVYGGVGYLKKEFIPIIGLSYAFEKE